MKVKDLQVSDLRTRYYDNINRLIEELKTIDPEADATAYSAAQLISRRDNEDRTILSFTESGTVTRFLVPLIGKPSSYTDKTIQYEKSWNPHRGWVAKKEVKATFVTWKGLSLQKAVEICNLLSKKCIEFGMSNKGVLELLFPENTPPSCFYTSEVPEVWLKKQMQKIKSGQVSAVTKRLDRR